LITSQVITSFPQKRIQSLNGDGSELIEEAKEMAKKVPPGFGATAYLCGRFRFNSVVPNRPTNQCEVSFVSFDFECTMHPLTAIEPRK